MAQSRLVAMTMVLAIVAGCGGAPVTASAPEPACARPSADWVHLPMIVRVEPSGEIAGGDEAVVTEIAALLQSREDFVVARVEGHPTCEGTSMEEALAAAERVARRLEAAGVPARRMETIGFGAGRCGLCPCASPAEKRSSKKCSDRCDPDPRERSGEVRVELSVRVCT